MMCRTLCRPMLRRDKNLFVMLERGTIPIEDALYIDTYNKQVKREICGTIHTRISNGNHWYVSQMMMNNENIETTELRLTPQSRVTPLGDCRFDIDGHVLRFAIRKLTPRECFRLMDVSEENIDKIQSYREPEDGVLQNALGEPILSLNGKPQALKKGETISKTRQYEMAGNSIVVSCLVGIFGELLKAYIPCDDETTA